MEVTEPAQQDTTLPIAEGGNDLFLSVVYRELLHLCSLTTQYPSCQGSLATSAGSRLMRLRRITSHSSP
ncbi:hypothetical protein EB796_018187 [Bugula neritina]|uniref:Uncharacterized protein n=1 Tax=Bugula neritina TaxID=10212 RepID=A0A7J7JBX3_BUGNE|nr:hypothetical protein EB796_018187 [Bugula neritina]